MGQRMEFLLIPNLALSMGPALEEVRGALDPPEPAAKDLCFLPALILRQCLINCGPRTVVTQKNQWLTYLHYYMTK